MIGADALASANRLRKLPGDRPGDRLRKLPGDQFGEPVT
jgi:hypothetical protein